MSALHFHELIPQNGYTGHAMTDEQALVTRETFLANFKDGYEDDAVFHVDHFHDASATGSGIGSSGNSYAWHPARVSIFARVSNVPAPTAATYMELVATDNDCDICDGQRRGN